MTTTTTTTQKQLLERFFRRHRLLDAARGIARDDNTFSKQQLPSQSKSSTTAAATTSQHERHYHQHQQRLLKCFPLQSHHVQSLCCYSSSNKSSSSSSSSSPLPPATPTDFHSALCNMIRGAKHRVYLASLYIGPGSSSHVREQELLNAINEVATLSSSSTSKDMSKTTEENQDDNNNNKSVTVKIILDKNRALRPVPVEETSMPKHPKHSHTSSAQAVAESLSSSGSLYLFQVLSNPILRSILPNPLNEVAGVFHIKAYVIDDSLILSGANLSEEYFSNRQDRYLWIRNGGNGLVQFYVDLIDILCNHAEVYPTTTTTTTTIHDGKVDKTVSDNKHGQSVRQTRTTTKEFLDQLTNLFTNDTMSSSSSSTAVMGTLADETKSPLKDPNTVALCIPTFQAPIGYFDNVIQDSSNDRNDDGDNYRLPFPSDVEVTNRMLEEAAAQHDDGNHFKVCLSSAYLNPTKSLLDRLQKLHSIELLSAGQISHGFRPSKNKTQSDNIKDKSNQGKEWIPTIFNHLAIETMKELLSANMATTKLFHWERQGWTFHSKGLWLYQSTNQYNDTEKTTTIKDNNKQDKQRENYDTDELVAAIVGSANFGARSHYRDMESNCIFIFAPPTTNQEQDHHRHHTSWREDINLEWKVMRDDSHHVQDPTLLLEKSSPLPMHIRLSLPWIKNFF